jgi:hypothetical protein
MMVKVVNDVCERSRWTLSVGLGEEEEIHLTVPMQMFDLFGGKIEEDDKNELLVIHYENSESTPQNTQSQQHNHE